MLTIHNCKDIYHLYNKIPTRHLQHGDQTFLHNDDLIKLGLNDHMYFLKLNYSTEQFNEIIQWAYNNFGVQTLELILKGSTYGPDQIYSAHAKWFTIQHGIFVKDDETLMQFKLRW